MSTIKKKFLLLKSKQFTSSLIAKECRLKGVNLKFPFTYIPKQVVKILSRKLKKIFDTVSLSRSIKKRIQHLQMIKTYKGIRHKKGLPVRGQRTHTNAKTRKKNRSRELVIRDSNSKI
ncbi:MAG TPA: 30S ribosomal protein S13 [Chitinophagales bacterium]|nr:30S ribosomal protein S13 [Chitinophagales bacterium]